MNLNLNVVISESQTTIHFDDDATKIIIDESSKALPFEENAIVFFMKEKTLVNICEKCDTVALSAANFDTQIQILPPEAIEFDYTKRALIQHATNLGIQLQNVPAEPLTIPKVHYKHIAEYIDKILLVLQKFGYPIKPTVKRKPAKTQHRWRKEICQIPFFVDTRESKATIFWQKRNEMLLKAGATLMKKPPLNKDGSLGFSAKMGEKIRDDLKASIHNFTTTEDIILKSVNEVGLLLYFGGTNSWLELLDEHGKSIDEWTKVDE